VPELPILDARGNLLEIALDIIVAFMAFPEDQERREEYLAVVIVETCGDNPEALRAAADAVPWLVPALSRQRTAGGVVSAAKRATGSAWAAGEILVTMLAVSLHHPEIDVGVSMTIDVIDQFQRGGPASIGNRTLWDVWSKFRSVSHFYAVRRLWDISVADPEGLNWEGWISDAFDEYLVLAEGIRKMAVTRRFLSHEETWRVPDSMSLPPAHIEPGALRPEMLSLFQSYSPKHSKR
jgi:hypothetical protein